MDKCRFIATGGNIWCDVHPPSSPATSFPALCRHAADDLERHYNDAVNKYQQDRVEWDRMYEEDCQRIARLEEEKAQAETVKQAHLGRIRHLSAEVARYMAGQEVGEARLTQAEAREAAMRVTFQRIVKHATDEKSPETAPPRNRLQNIVCLAEAVLSPDAGRALAAEVERLREVARAADKVIADWEASCRDHPVDYAKPQTLHPFGPAIGWQSLHGLRDALGKRGEGTP